MEGGGGTTRGGGVDMTGGGGGNGHDDLAPTHKSLARTDRYVVFHSNATDLVSTPSSGRDSYLRDLLTGTTILLSASAVDGHAVSAGTSEVINPDGRYAAFTTASPNVVSMPSSGPQVYAYGTSRPEYLSLASIDALAGTAGGNGGSVLTILTTSRSSPNGEFLSFQSLATNLTAGVVSTNRNLYVRNLNAGQTLLVTPNQHRDRRR